MADATDPTQISKLVDSLTQADLTAIGSAVAVALSHAYLAHSQAHGVLFANMVHAQQQTAMASHAATVEAVNRTLQGGAPAGVAGASAYGGGGGGDDISKQELMEAMRASAPSGAPVVT